MFRKILYNTIIFIVKIMKISCLFVDYFRQLITLDKKGAGSLENRIPKIKNTELKIVASAGAVHYGNGYLFKPIKLGHFSAATTKTLTRLPRHGNFRWYKPWETIKPIDDFGNVDYLNYSGFVNAVGLSNMGIEKWIDEYYRKITTPEKIIVSIAAESADDLLEMIRLTDLLNVLAVEPNLTCPNDAFCMDKWMTDEAAFIKALKIICENSRHPVVLKLSAAQNYAKIAESLKDKVSAISINSVPWKIVFPDKVSPLECFGGGGVSGKTARAFTWKMSLSISRIVDVPVIIPGIWEANDLEKINKMGRWNLVPSIGSGSIPPPFLEPLKIIKRALKPA